MLMMLRVTIWMVLQTRVDLDTASGTVARTRQKEATMHRRTDDANIWTHTERYG